MSIIFYHVFIEITMLASISGTITSINHHTLHVQQNNVGFEIFCPHAHTLQEQTTVFLHTYLHWNQEQGPSLFGFLQPLDKEVFLYIISCPGIGPKLGLSILEQLDATQFLHLISEENIAQLSTLKHIGQKKAEQLCLHLKNKVSKMILTKTSLATKLPTSVWRDLHDTLTSLSYAPSEIKQTTTILKQELDGQSPNFDFLLRKALQLLSKR